VISRGGASRAADERRRQEVEACNAARAQESLAGAGRVEGEFRAV